MNCKQAETRLWSPTGSCLEQRISGTGQILHACIVKLHEWKWEISKQRLRDRYQGNRVPPYLIPFASGPGRPGPVFPAATVREIGDENGEAQFWHCLLGLGRAHIGVDSHGRPGPPSGSPQRSPDYANQVHCRFRLGPRQSGGQRSAPVSFRTSGR